MNCNVKHCVRETLNFLTLFCFQPSKD